MSRFHLYPGDRVVVPKSQFRLVHHHAIFDGYGYFYENKFGHGVVRTSFSEFFKNISEIKEIHRFRGTNTQLRAALDRAESLVGKSYDLVEFNCEHFADYVQFGRGRSRQVETVMGLGAIALVTWAVSQLARK